jgi:hypothetical protein
VSALRALDRHDPAALRAELGEACRLFPELSSATRLLGHHLSNQLPRAHEPSERLWYFSEAARAWPNPHARAAVYLRGRAIGIALAGGSVGLAARLLAGWAPRTFPMSASMAFWILRDRLRRRRARLGRGMRPVTDRGLR